MALLANLLVFVVVIGLIFLGIAILAPIYRKSVRAAEERDRVDEDLRRRLEKEEAEQAQLRKQAEQEVENLLDNNHHE